MGFHSRQGGHRVAVHIEGGLADRRVGALDHAGAQVADAQDVLAGRQRIGCHHPLLLLAEEVVDELQPAVGHE